MDVKIDDEILPNNSDCVQNRKFEKLTDNKNHDFAEASVSEISKIIPSKPAKKPLGFPIWNGTRRREVRLCHGALRSLIRLNHFKETEWKIIFSSEGNVNEVVVDDDDQWIDEIKIEDWVGNYADIIKLLYKNKQLKKNAETQTDEELENGSSWNAMHLALQKHEMDTKKIGDACELDEKKNEASEDEGENPNLT